MNSGRELFWEQPEMLILFLFLDEGMQQSWHSRMPETLSMPRTQSMAHRSAGCGSSSGRQRGSSTAPASWEPTRCSGNTSLHLVNTRHSLLV